MQIKIGEKAVLTSGGAVPGNIAAGDMCNVVMRVRAYVMGQFYGTSLGMEKVKVVPQVDEFEL